MEPPIPPNEEDCCNSGCNPCIFDVYEENLKRFRANEHNLKPTKINCISQTAYSVFKLIEKDLHTKDTFLMVFQYTRQFRGTDLNSENLRLDFDPGQHFLMRGLSEGFTRAYTPLLSGDLEKLRFRIVAKVYEGGQMSRLIRNLRIGKETLWRGPYGDFKINYNYKHILAIAQGTGVAPIYSVLYKVLEDERFECFFTLYYCCRSLNDILLRDELHSMLKYWNFKYEVFLSDYKAKNSKYNEVIHDSKLSKYNVSNYLKNKTNVQVLICGSENFSKCMLEYLEGFDSEHVFVF